jgi:hypothetical protein
MAIGFPAGITEAYIINNAQQKLTALRDALVACEEFYQDSVAPYAITDYEAAPISMDAASAQAIFTAFADANAMYQIYNTGQAPGTYPQVTSPYVYAASQRIVIGPLS